MEWNGVEIVTTEMVVFEWPATRRNPRFREAVALIKLTAVGPHGEFARRSKNSVIRTLPLSPMRQTRVCGLLFFPSLT